MNTNLLNKNSITLLCKVVDNYGDIGFVYRLSRSLSKLAPEKKLTLVVSNLDSFSSMAPEINPKLPIQECFGWTVLDWNADETCTKYFTETPPEVILECFQCGRPDWLENIIFAKGNEKLYQIVNVEYLTAEEWADDFHLLKSATRSQFVKKVNFMPGFTEKTGGLVLDANFMSFLKSKNTAMEALSNHLAKADLDTLKDENTFCVTLFSYPREYENIISALLDFENEAKKLNSNFKVHIFCANGSCYKNLCETQNASLISNSQLPYLPQSAWDALLTQCDFNFIRGEDSFSRACLSGKPFIWHAYIQDQEFQLVKAQAILERIRPFLEKEDFNKLCKYTMLYNHDEEKDFDEESKKAYESYIEQEKCTIDDKTTLLKNILSRNNEIRIGFENFSKKLISNGDLASKLLTYIDSL